MRNKITLLVGLIIIIVLANNRFYFQKQSLDSDDVKQTVIENPLGTKTVVAQSQRVDFRVLETGVQTSGVSERKNYAAYSQEGLEKMWKMLGRKDLPKIDFSKEYVIGVFAGQKSTGGHTIAVSSVTDMEQVRTVAVVLTSPDTNCVVAQSITNPYQILVVPLSYAQLAHTDSKTLTQCE